MLASTEVFLYLLLTSLFTQSSRLKGSAGGIQPAAHKVVYIGVISAPRNIEKRMRVRQSYLTKLREANTDGRVLAEFIIGHEALVGVGHQQGIQARLEDQKLEEEIIAEAKTFGDVRRIMLPETYQNLPDKTLHFLQQGVALKYDFLLKADDDQEVDLEFVEKYASNHNGSELIYAGRSLFDKEAYASQEGADGKFVPYFSGSCYLLSFGLANLIVGVNSTHTGQFLSYGSSSEDVDMGRWVEWEKRLGHDVIYETLSGLAK
mmetsp:Transcript_125271/g.198562  ORF Transcript_125271/g.198562 Transcript_125271/m.198562 type:complete len:262 (+) Transcript_125271:68-853(+)